MAAFATIADLQTYNRADIDAAAFGAAEAALEAATAQIQAYTGQTLFLVEGDTISAVPRSGRIFLPQLPVVEVTSVLDDEGDAVSDWELFPAGVLHLSTATSLMTVTYSHGYATIPHGVRAACVQLAAGLFGQESGVVRSESIGSYSVTYEVGTVAASAAWQALVSPYRMPALA